MTTLIFEGSPGMINTSFDGFDEDAFASFVNILSTEFPLMAPFDVHAIMNDLKLDSVNSLRKSFAHEIKSVCALERFGNSSGTMLSTQGRGLKGSVQDWVWVSIGLQTRGNRWRRQGGEPLIDEVDGR